MNDPKRFIDEGDEGAALLASGRGDAPSGRARERAMAAVGLSVATLTTGTAAAGAGTAKVAATALWLKVVAGAVVAVAVAGGGAVVLERSSAPRPPSRAGAPPGEATTASAPSTAVAAPPAETAAEAPALALAPPSASASASASVSVSASVPAVSPTVAPPPRASSSARHSSTESLAHELRMLDAARSAVDRGDANGAIEVLDRYDRTFARPALGVEAKMVRIDALLARGDQAGARKLAADLLARDPAGPHARRLRSILGD